MAKNRSHKTYNLGWSRLNDKWLLVSHERHFCLIIILHSGMSYFCYHAQISSLNNRNVYERAYKNTFGEKISSCERHQTVFYCNERWNSEIGNLNSTLQKFVNCSMHTFR